MSSKKAFSSPRKAASPEPIVPTDDSILSAMLEGVVALDRGGNVVSINPAAIRLLRLPSTVTVGSPLTSFVTSDAVRAFIERVVLLRAPLEEEFQIPDEGGKDRLLQAYSRMLRDNCGNEGSVLIVITDSTRVRHLETVRRDFVANVSHELKTPITSIRGFVETLLDGAMKNPEDAERFLKIISRQADRLNNIFEDLLTLAKVEQEEEASKVELSTGSIRKVLEAAVQNSEFRASEKGVSMELSCDAALVAPINARLLEQAVSNLVENAVKYSEFGDRVEVQALREGSEVVIKVRDYGCGIDEAHLPRLWERFYRADQARSRKRGGTGLGLSIVKHIAQAHGGYAAVESTLGEGSTFSIHLQFETRE